MANDEIQIQSRGWAGDDSARRVLTSASQEAQADFRSVLAQASQSDGTPQTRARKAAEELVATALVGPVFKGLRESNGAAEPFKPNAAERSFGQLLDTTLAQRMVSSTHWPLVDSVARQLLSKTQAEAQETRAPLSQQPGT